jgi:hypothetical protein
MNLIPICTRLLPNWTRRQDSEFPRITKTSRTLLSPINRPLDNTTPHTILETKYTQSREEELNATFRSGFHLFLFPLFLVLF